MGSKVLTNLNCLSETTSSSLVQQAHCFFRQLRCDTSSSESKLIIYFIYNNSQMTDWSAICVKAPFPWTTANKIESLDAAERDEQSVASLPLNWWCKERNSCCIERDAKTTRPVYRKMICTARLVGLTTPANLSAVKDICVMLVCLLLSTLSPSLYAFCCHVLSIRYD